MTSALNHPSLYTDILFRAKASLLQIKRGIHDLLEFKKIYPKNDALHDRTAIATCTTPLWNHGLNGIERAAERELQLGKIQNLAIAAQTIHGIEIPQDGIFSFWAYVGRPTRIKGYVKGREIRQGCMIPSIGGGLCQLSNALYSVALDAGFEILERHAHTQIIPGSLAEIGRDATVFWNYVDLRFKVNQAVRFEVTLTGDALVVQIKGMEQEHPPAADFRITLQDPERPTLDRTHDCLSCNMQSCHRNVPQIMQPPQKLKEFAKTAYLVDEYWIEFDRYIQSQRSDQDLLAIPLDGKRFKKRNYAWNQTGFAQVKRATFLTLTRALAMRNLSPQGASLQSTLWKYDRKLAEYFSSLLTHDVSHVVVTQNLLPFLWQNGSLKGKTFDVLITRSPLAVLQEKLNSAYALHPHSPTLNDFRLSAEFVDLETQALAIARQLITPHTAIAALFPEKTHLLDWQIPEIKPANLPLTNSTKGNRILFPASAIARKGAYEVREVAQKLNLELTVLGRELEGENFWQDLTIHKPNPNYLEDVGLVILPAFVEHKPRILLEAIAHQIPVIASFECGLGNLVTQIPSGDAAALLDAIEKFQSSHSLKLPARVIS
jgi:hypothetical protein